MQGFASISDDALLRDLHAIVGSHRRVTAELIVHLGEVDARRLHVDKGFSSLFSYCLERLHFSEDEACRRIEAARLARRFPTIVPLLQTGAVSLSVLGLLKPHLTEDNHRALLVGVSGSSVRQAREWLAAQFPQPDVPATIRKQAPRHVAQVAQPLAPVAPTRVRVAPLSQDRFLVKFTASRVMRDKLEHARDLMCHANPGGEMAVVLERALDLLIAELEKKQGRTSRLQTQPRPAKDTHVTRAIRREVVERDGWRCSFVAEDGRRCDARGFLEFDHKTPKGRGGSSRAENLRVLCRAHNRWAAERVYGKAQMARAILDSRRFAIATRMKS